jgi:threonine/homoserine/homoserine lactone efflux protein
MDPTLLARAVAFGFAAAAAVGPISVLTIRRTLAHGRAYGLASGLGVASADASYAAVAACGLTALTSVLVGGRVLLGVAGGAVIALLGVRTLLSGPAKAASATDRPGLAAAFVSIYGLTLTNPMTILTFVALFAALGAIGGGIAGPLTVVAGVFAGSLLWWIVLTTAVGWLRSRITPRALMWVNRVSGALLVAFGIAAVVTVLVAAR